MGVEKCMTGIGIRNTFISLAINAFYFSQKTLFGFASISVVKDDLDWCR